jgi:YVTN family beta-propeller protein
MVIALQIKKEIGLYFFHKKELTIFPFSSIIGIIKEAKDFVHSKQHTSQRIYKVKIAFTDMEEVTFSQFWVPAVSSVGSIGVGAFIKWMLKSSKCNCFNQTTKETLIQGVAAVKEAGSVIKEVGSVVTEHKGCIEKIKSFCAPSQWFELTYIVGRLGGGQQEGQGRVWVVDPRNPFSSQKMIEIGNSPVGMAVTSDQQKVYIVCQGDQAIYVISTWENEVVEIITGLLSEPEEIAITPDGRKAYITYRTDTRITMVKISQKCGRCLKLGCIAQLKICATTHCSCTCPNRIEHIFIGKMTNGIGMAPDGKYVYLANYDSRTFTVIDVKADTVKATVNLTDHPMKFVIGPIPNQDLYVLNAQSITRTNPNAWHDVESILEGTHPSNYQYSYS